MFSINNLKYELGSGVRKSKYLLEIGSSDIARKINILTKSASFPERTIGVASAYKYGKKYNFRAETDFTGTFEITVIDDANMSIRKSIDEWMNSVDIFEDGQVTNIDGYQTSINLWQLDSNGEKLYGYEIQNAFPTNMGTVTYDDSTQNELVEYTITFTYTSFIPIEGVVNTNNITAY